MDSDGYAAEILILLLFILVDFMIYGFATAIQAIGEKEKKLLEQRCSEQASNRASYKKLLLILEHPLQYSDSLQSTIFALNLPVGFLCLKALFLQVIKSDISRLLSTYFLTVSFWEITICVIACLCFIVVFLTIGILLPKRVAVLHPCSFALMFVNLVTFICMMLKPLTVPANKLSGLILRLFGIKKVSTIPDVTEEEIISMVNEGHEQGLLEKSEMEMINNIIEFGDKEAKDIMCNRSNIVGIDKESTIQQAADFMLSQNNSRYPVFFQDLDCIVGILYLKDTLRMLSRSNCKDKLLCDSDDLIRPAIFVPETKNIDEIFRIMQTQKTQIVIVIDEYGQTTGLITMEDILEEIVGNIMDEYDEADEFIEEKNENEYLIDGLTPLDELEEKFNIHFETEEFDTLNGYLISKMEHIPQENEDFSIDIGEYHFKIQEVADKVIQTVLVTRAERNDTSISASEEKND